MATPCNILTNIFAYYCLVKNIVWWRGEGGSVRCRSVESEPLCSDFCMINNSTENALIKDDTTDDHRKRNNNRTSPTSRPSFDYNRFGTLPTTANCRQHNKLQSHMMMDLMTLIDVTTTSTNITGSDATDFVLSDTGSSSSQWLSFHGQGQILAVLERGNGQTWLRGHRDQQMTPIMSGLLRSTTNTRIAKNSPLKADRKTTLEQ